MPCAARAKFRIDGWLACKACWGDTPRLRTPAAPAALRAALICAPILARFVAACALTPALDASINATARQSGLNLSGFHSDRTWVNSDWLTLRPLIRYFPVIGDADNVLQAHGHTAKSAGP